MTELPVATVIDVEKCLIEEVASATWGMDGAIKLAALAHKILLDKLHEERVPSGKLKGGNRMTCVKEGRHQFGSVYITRTSSVFGKQTYPYRRCMQCDDEVGRGRKFVPVAERNLCECGHAGGVHEDGTYECYYATPGGMVNQFDCECTKFKASKETRA